MLDLGISFMNVGNLFFGTSRVMGRSYPASEALRSISLMDEEKVVIAFQWLKQDSGILFKNHPEVQQLAEALRLQMYKLVNLAKRSEKDSLNNYFGQVLGMGCEWREKSFLK